MAPKHSRPPLLVSVWAELGAGQMTEVFLHDDKLRLHGETVGRHIYVNPAYSVVDTVVHEILHRLRPAWSERYVRNRTSYLLHRMTEEEIERFYEEYQKRVHKRKSS